MVCTQWRTRGGGGGGGKRGSYFDSLNSYFESLNSYFSLGFPCSNIGSIRDDPYLTSRKNSIEPIELSSINKVSFSYLIMFFTLVRTKPFIPQTVSVLCVYYSLT